MALTLVIGNKKSIPPGRCGPGWPCAKPEFPSGKSACRWRVEVERAYVATVLASRAIQAWLAASRSETEVLPRSELPEVAA
jgi:hypothetical protein